MHHLGGQTYNEWLAEHWPRWLQRIDRRYLITELFLRDPNRIWTPKELAAVLVADGFDLREPANKEVADTLRAEVHSGRVERIGHGSYRLGTVPDSTRRRIRHRAQIRRAALRHS